MEKRLEALEQACTDLVYRQSSAKRMKGIVLYLKEIIDGYHGMGYHVITHTDGSVKPILERRAAGGNQPARKI